MKISISMITLNEEKNITRALSSCTFADEIVVVDGGSTDGTLDILRSHGKVVLIQQTWEGHFGKQRQISLDNCSGDWVVRLDADEAFSQIIEENIRAVLESTPPDTVGYFIRQCNLVGDEKYYSNSADNYENIPRIWRNLKVARWEGRVHELLTGLEGGFAKQWDVYIVHYGLLDKKRLWNKGLQYSQIEEAGFNTPEALIYRDYDVQLRPSRSRVSSWVPPYPPEKRSGLPGVAILRGPNLNLWEMQNYEPLCKSFDITSYTTNQPSFDISHINVPIVKLPPHPKNPAYMVGLEAELLDKDIIYTADITWIFTYQAAIMKQKFGKRIVALEWENIPFAYEEDGQMREMKRFNRQMVDHFIAVTERAKDALILEGVPEEKISVIPMGINIDRFRPDEESGTRLRRELGIGKGEKVILFTGRMVWEKGIYDLLYAAGLLELDCHMENEAVRFLIVGKGPESECVKNRVRELGLEHLFTFMESYPYHRMHEMFNMADIFVLPSISARTWKEQFGMVLIEAMACGLPVISTCSGSIPEVVGDAGILVQPNDPRGLYQAIKGLLNNGEHRMELGKKGMERAIREYDANKIATKIGQLFEELLQSSVQNQKGTDEAIGRDYFRQGRREVEALVPVEAMRILDVGCGEGILGKRLLDRGAAEVVGIEVDPAAGERAKENLSLVLQGDAEFLELPFEEGYFDCIICADVLEHLKEPLITLRRFNRYLADSGTIIASIPNVRYYGVINMLVEGEWKYQDYGILDKTHLRFFTRKDIDALFKEAGFEITGIAVNMDPGYTSLNAPFSGEISFGRVKLRGVSHEELKDLFVIQYLVKAEKTGNKKMSDAMNTAIDSEDFGKAIDILEEYLEQHPADADSLYRHAEVCHRMGQPDKALDSIDKLLLFEPERSDAIELKCKISMVSSRG